MCWRPHDLLWLSRDRLRAAQPDLALPDWAVRGAGPVVVRRAPPPAPGWVAVGIRGDNKQRRVAAFAPVTAVIRWLGPYSIARGRLWSTHPQRDQHPVLRTLQRLAPVLDRLVPRWGVTGSLGYECATGTPQLHGGSDLDLLIDGVQGVSRAQAAGWLAALPDTECRVDIQLETPLGSIALAEWAGAESHTHTQAPAQVMLRTQTGPLLTADPWALARQRTH